MMSEPWKDVLRYRSNVERRLQTVDGLLKVFTSIESTPPFTFLVVPPGLDVEQETNVNQWVDAQLGMFKWMLEEGETSRYSEFLRLFQTYRFFQRPSSSMSTTTSMSKDFSSLSVDHDHPNAVILWFFQPPGGDSTSSLVEVLGDVLKYYLYSQQIEKKETWSVDPQTSNDLKRFKNFWAKLYTVAESIDVKLFSRVQSDMEVLQESVSVNGTSYERENMFLKALETEDEVEITKLHDVFMEDSKTSVNMYMAVHDLYQFYTDVYVKIQELQSQVSSLTVSDDSKRSLQTYVTLFRKHQKDTVQILSDYSNVPFLPPVLQVLKGIQKQLSEEILDQMMLFPEDTEFSDLRRDLMFPSRDVNTNYKINTMASNDNYSSTSIQSSSSISSSTVNGVEVGDEEKETVNSNSGNDTNTESVTTTSTTPNSTITTTTTGSSMSYTMEINFLLFMNTISIVLLIVLLYRSFGRRRFQSS